MIIIKVPRLYINFKRRKLIYIIETEISKGNNYNREKITSIFLKVKRDLENEFYLFNWARDIRDIDESSEFLRILNMKNEIELCHNFSRKEDLYFLLNLVKTFYR